MSARRRLADVAAGRLPADLVLTNGKVFETGSGEFREVDVAIDGDRIAGLGRYHGLQSLDLRGRVVLPGFIDAGAMLEPTHLLLAEYARLLVSRGTTAVLLDFRDLAAVLGLGGLATLLEEARQAPLDVFCALPLSAGASWDSTGARFDRLDPLLLSLPNVVARGGRLDGEAVLRDPAILEAPTGDTRLPAIVAAPGRGGQEAAALAAIGVAADRAWESRDEALDKLRAGLWLLGAEGPLATSVSDLKWLSRHTRLERCCLVSGLRGIADLFEHGHLDDALRQAVRAGLPPAEAVRLVTSQPAALLALPGRGAILPGYLADLVVVSDLRSFTAHLVLKAGRPVAREGELLLPAPRAGVRHGSALRLGPFSIERLALRGHPGRCRVIGLEEDGSTTSLWAEPPCTNGLLAANPEHDLAKVAVIERHSGKGGAALGFVHGLGLHDGALCCSFAGVGQHLIVAGMDDLSMARALEQVAGDGGGMAVARRDRVVAAVALPYAGILSPLPSAALADEINQVETAAWDLGCALSRPFLLLAGLADTSQGQLRLTDRGLVDVAGQGLLPLQE